MDGERREEPPLYRIVAEHLWVTDEVTVGPGLAVDDDAEHVEDGVTMAVERRALQRVALSHCVVLPLLVELLEGQTAMRLERIDDPDVLTEYLSWFHSLRGNAPLN